jgi:hypothetical protein
MTLDALTQDLGFAFRGLRRARAFTTVAILTLALGIVGTTTIVRARQRRPPAAASGRRAGAADSRVEAAAVLRIRTRVALGATAADVRRLVLREAVVVAGPGAAIGTIGTAAITPAMRGMLFEVHPLDPFTILTAALLLIGASVLASWLLVRRGAALDPAVTLRSE